MRPSHRRGILAAALRVVENGGISALSLDAVAVEAGLTKGGLLYHFPSRDALLLAVHEHLAELWREELTRTAGGPPSELTAEERLAAYVRANTLSVTRTELALMLEAAADPDHSAPAAQVIDTWAPAPPRDVADEEAMRRFLARIASDGLWLYGALGQEPISEEIRTAIAERILTVLPPGQVRPWSSGG